MRGHEVAGLGALKPPWLPWPVCERGVMARPPRIAAGRGSWPAKLRKLTMMEGCGVLADPIRLTSLIEQRAGKLAQPVVDENAADIILGGEEFRRCRRPAPWHWPSRQIDQIGAAIGRHHHIGILRIAQKCPRRLPTAWRRCRNPRRQSFGPDRTAAHAAQLARSTARNPLLRSLSGAPGSRRAEGLVALAWVTVTKPWSAVTKTSVVLSRPCSLARPASRPAWCRHRACRPGRWGR